MSHPHPELLLSFAGGQADLPHRVMLEAHLAGCAECRGALAEVSAPGGALLRGVAAEAPPPQLWERLRGQVAGSVESQFARDIAVRPAPESPLAGMPLPAAARAELAEVRPLRWHWGFARGARFAALARDAATRSVLLIGYMPARRAFPRHVHVGPEDIVVLTGGYEDHLGHYEAGEYVAYSPGTEHRPVVEPGETCWTLTRLEQPNRILGWQGWLQRFLA